MEKTIFTVIGCIVLFAIIIAAGYAIEGNDLPNFWEDDEKEKKQ